MGYISKTTPQRYRWLASLAFLPGLFLAFSPVSLLTDIPEGPLAPIKLSGQFLPSEPVVDSQGNTIIVWRGISGAIYKELVESVFMQKVGPDGSLAFGRTARVIAQAMHEPLDTTARQAAEEHGAVPDGQGGIFYLWSAYGMHFNPSGERSWPLGDQYGGEALVPVEGDIWKYPSPARITTDEKAWITSGAEFYPDGQGNALVFWHHAPQTGKSASYRAQKISRQGQMLWGPEGISLTSPKGYSHGKAVPDGKGGAVALVTQGNNTSVSKVVFISSEGKKTREIDKLPLDLQDENLYRVAPDGAGGIYVLNHNHTNEDGTLWFAIHLMRFNAQGQVFDTPLTPGKTTGKWQDLYLEADSQGALVSWRTNRTGPSSDEFIRQAFLARVNPQGQKHWKKQVKLEFPGQVKGGTPETADEYTPNDHGSLDMLAIGQDTYVLLESLVPSAESEVTGVMQSVWLQKIAPDGSMAYPGIGQPLKENGAFYPFLLNVKGRPAAVFYDAQTIGGIEEFPIPYFTLIGD